MQCSTLVFQLLIQADVSCKLGTVLSESFLSGGKQFAARISLNKKLKDQRGALYSPFSLFYTIKAPNEKLTFLGDFFQPPYTEPERPSLRVTFQSHGSVYEVAYPWLIKNPRLK